MRDALFISTLTTLVFQLSVYLGYGILDFSKTKLDTLKKTQEPKLAIELLFKTLLSVVFLISTIATLILTLFVFDVLVSVSLLVAMLFLFYFGTDKKLASFIRILLLLTILVLLKL